jgi:hypothetical protein
MGAVDDAGLRPGGERGSGLAVKLERRYSKDQILGMYLDAAYFGGGHWGSCRPARGTSAGRPRT